MTHFIHRLSLERTCYWIADRLLIRYSNHLDGRSARDRPITGHNYLNERFSSSIHSTSYKSTIPSAQLYNMQRFFSRLHKDSPSNSPAASTTAPITMPFSSEPFIPMAAAVHQILTRHTSSPSSRPSSTLSRGTETCSAPISTLALYGHFARAQTPRDPSGEGRKREEGKGEEVGAFPRTSQRLPESWTVQGLRVRDFSAARSC